MIIAFLLTAIVMVIAFFVASLIQVKPVQGEESASHELWLYGVTLTFVTLVSGIFFLLLY